MRIQREGSRLQAVERGLARNHLPAPWSWTSSLQSAEQINFCCFSFLVAVGVLASQYTHRFQAWKQWTPPPTNKDTQTRFLRAHCRQGVRIISTAEGESLLVESREGIRCAPTGSCCHGEAGGRLTRSRASPVLG